MNEKMLCFFPLKKGEFNEKNEEYFEGLETIVIEDVFMPQVIELIYKNEDVELLILMFKYFEKVLNSGNEYFINVFSRTA